MSDVPVHDDVPERPRPAVRVLHTSDWHLGVAVRNHSRTEDHEAVIAEIIEVARVAEPDLILHTGDLFDGHRPALGDFGLAIRALRDLATIAPVALLSGNHDSPVALTVLGVAVEDEVPAALAAGTFDPHAETTNRIRVHAKPVVAENGAITSYPTRAGGTLRLVALPFVHQNRVLSTFSDLVETNATYNDSLRKIVGSYSSVCFDQFDPARDVAVFASHLHVKDARTSSEKMIHIADDYATDPAHFEPRYGYLAFGHIHVPQPVANGRGRYAGSILEVDYGEEGEEKQVVIADLIPGRPTQIHSVLLRAGRRLCRVRAPLSELADRADAVGNGIVEVTVVAEPAEQTGLFADPQAIEVGGIAFESLSAAVAAVLPDATVVSVIDARNPAAVGADELDAPAVAESVGDTFRTWLAGAGSAVVAKGEGRADVTRVAELFDEIHAAAASDAPPDLAEEALLTAKELTG